MPRFLLTLLSLIILSTVTTQSVASDHGGGDSAQPHSSLFAGLKARLVGPAGMSGRIAAVDAVASDPNTIVVGASTGGLWMSHNGGLNWTPVFDDQPVASIGAVAINQGNPDIIWVGTGEGNVRNSTSVGGGVYKSVDGGKSFTYMGLGRTERIHRIALHPDNPNVAYVAALGQLWSENPERGIFKTNDGGKTWSKVLYVDEKTGATDIQMVPGNPNKLFAGMWQFRRWPYFFKSGGEGSGLYVSHDGGESWDKLTEDDGLPAGEIGRSAFAISKSNPSRVYALIEAEKSALARSDDGGKSWKLVNQDTDINDRPFYYNDLAVDPKDSNRVYRVGSRVKLSIDGGKTFEYMPAIDCCASSNSVHIDTHAWWINPSDPRHMIDGNDGGIAVTHDHGQTWRFVENLPLAQFYHIAVDNAVPYNIYGGLQDNGSWKGPSEVWENGGIRNFHWQEVAFGDGFDTRPDPENHREGYAMSQGGALYHWNQDTAELRFIKPPAHTHDDGTLADMRYNWNAGLAIDPFDPSTLYYGSQFVHKSTDRGETWEVISADLTTNNPEFQTFRTSGGLTSDVTAAENYTTITSIAPSPVKKGVIWVGTDDGRVHVTRDGGNSWTAVEGNLPTGRGHARAGAWVPMIAPSPHDAAVAMITMDDHRRGHMKPHAYKLTDYGQTWTSLITADVSGYALSILQDPVDPDLIFLGTEFGLHVSLDGGAHWMKWTQGLPTVSIADLAIQAREHDLVVGTHGRAAFVIDDYRALRGLTSADFDKRFSLLSVSDGQLYSTQQAASSRFTGSGEFRADNPAYGALITFIASGNDLSHPDEDAERARKTTMRDAKKAEAAKADEAEAEKSDADTNSQDGEEAESKTSDDDAETPGDKPVKATITVTDKDGTIIRTFKHDVHQGINRVAWNLRRDGVMPAPPGKAPEDGTLPAGPEVLPGAYTIEIALEEESASADIRVLADPRSPYDEEARAANYAMVMKAQTMAGTVNDALRQLVDIRDDVSTLTAMIDDHRDRHDIDEDDESHPVNGVAMKADTLQKALTSLEETFRVPPDTKGIVYDDDKISSKLGTAQFYLFSGPGKPSPAAEQAMGEADKALKEGLATLNTLVTEDMAVLRDAAREANLTLFSQTPLVAETPGGTTKN
ncbi:MAG: hypothetical protein AAGH42_02445 [Pseudomonadota bacterium]